MKCIKLKTTEELTRSETLQVETFCGQLYLSGVKSRLFIVEGYPFYSVKVADDSLNLQRLQNDFEKLAMWYYLSQLTSVDAIKTGVFLNIRKELFTECEIGALQRHYLPSLEDEEDPAGKLVNFVSDFVKKNVGKQLTDFEIFRVLKLAQSFECSVNFGIVNDHPSMVYQSRNPQVKRNTTADLLSLIYGRKYSYYEHIDESTGIEFSCYHIDLDLAIAKILDSVFMCAATYVLQADSTQEHYTLIDILSDKSDFVLPDDAQLV